MSTMQEKRNIPDRLGTSTARLLGSWEMLLLGVAILIFIANAFA
jgi:rhamnose transport system permease protein